MWKMDKDNRLCRENWNWELEQYETVWSNEPLITNYKTLTKVWAQIKTQKITSNFHDSFCLTVGVCTSLCCLLLSPFFLHWCCWSNILQTGAHFNWQMHPSHQFVAGLPVHRCHLRLSMAKRSSKVVAGKVCTWTRHTWLGSDLGCEHRQDSVYHSCLPKTGTKLDAKATKGLVMWF